MKPPLVPCRSAPFFYACALATCSAFGFAQSPAAKTLEIPTLVTDHEHRPIGDLKPDQFRIKVDNNLEFAPLAVHMQDKEPLTLSILIDASHDAYHDLTGIGDDLAAITSTMFLPQDRVSVYALDCTMVRALYNEVPTQENVRKAVTGALTYPKLHDHDHSPNCGKTVHLWDNVAAAVSTLSKLPGRRVLLLVTAGRDGGSKYDWQIVSKYAQDNEVAIFGMRDQRQVDADTFTPSSLTVQNGHTGGTITPTPATRDAAAIELLCANSGGTILNALPLHRNETLAYLLFIFRHRVILTIPSDAYSLATTHTLKVSVPHTPYFVSPAGVGTPEPAP